MRCFVRIIAINLIDGNAKRRQMLAKRIIPTRSYWVTENTQEILTLINRLFSATTPQNLSKNANFVS